MSMFTKKADTEQGPNTSAPPAARSGRTYGIAEAIQLLRGLPVDQNAELVVRVVRSTLESLNVHLPDIIEDASRKLHGIQERVTAVHGQVAELEKQLEARRQEIAAL